MADAAAKQKGQHSKKPEPPSPSPSPRLTISRPTSYRSLEVLEEPDDVIRNRLSTQPVFNSDFKKPTKQKLGDNLVYENVLESKNRLVVLDKATPGPPQFDEVSLDEESTDEEESEDRIPMLEVDLGNRIVIRYPEEYNFQSCYVSRPLDVQMRNVELALFQQKFGDCNFITDLYGIYEILGDKKEQLTVLPIEDSWREKVKLYISFDRKYSPHLLYYANLRRGKKGWKQKSADIQNNTAEFEGEAFDMFFVTATPKTELFTVDPSGKEFTSQYDDRIKLIFPPGCVENQEILNIQIIPQRVVDNICIGDKTCIVGASKAVHVEHEQGIFKEPVTTEMHLAMFGNSQDQDFTHFGFVDVHTTNSKKKEEINVRQLDPNNCKKTENGYSVRMEVTDLESHSVQFGDPTELNTETGKIQTKLAHKDIFHCHILLFLSKKSARNCQGNSIRVDCVERKQMDKTIAELRQEDYGFTELKKCRSAPQLIKDGARIRIDLRGGIKIPLGFRKDKMVITFLREGLHTHIVFPIETSFGNRPTNLGYFDFTIDGQNIYETFIDVDFPFPKTVANNRMQYNMQTPTGFGLDSATSRDNRMQYNMQTPTGFGLDSATSRDKKQIQRPVSQQETHPHIAEAAQGIKQIHRPVKEQETYHHITESAQDTHPVLTRPVATPSVVGRIILALSQRMPTDDWKFIFREMCAKCKMDSETIISEAECNNKDNVREVIFQSLKKWELKTNLRSPSEKFSTIITALDNLKHVKIKTELEEMFQSSI